MKSDFSGQSGKSSSQGHPSQQVRAAGGQRSEGSTGKRGEGKAVGKQERHRRSSMQSMNLLATLSHKTPVANHKQMKSWRDVKVRTRTAPLQGKGTIKKASLEALSLVFRDLLPPGWEMPQEVPCRRTARAEHGRLQPRRGASCQELLCLGTKEQDFPPNK